MSGRCLWTMPSPKAVPKARKGHGRDRCQPPRPRWVRCRCAEPSPGKERRTVGAWCFVDHMGPTTVTAERGWSRPSSPMGLQTVTWLLSGEAIHRDSLGSSRSSDQGSST